MRTRPAALALLGTSCLWISAEEHAKRLDFDGDGVPLTEDCNDHNPRIAPGMTELPCTLVDEDCDERTPDGPAFAGVLTYASAQEALDLAIPGAEITLCAGSVFESLVILQEAVTLSGNASGDPTVVNATAPDAPGITVVGAGVTLRNLVLVGGGGADHGGTTRGGVIDAYDARGDLRLEDVTVSGGAADYGAGVQGPTDHTLTLVRSIVKESAARIGGGGVATAGELVLEDTVIRTNSADVGGGLLLEGAASASGVGTSEIQENVATDGGGVSLGEGTLANVGVRENTASRRGGGVLAAGGNLVDVVLEDNTALGGGGLAGSATLDRGAVLSNSALGEPGGGGILADELLMRINGTAFADNEAVKGDGGSVLVVDPGSAEIHDDLSGVEPIVTVIERGHAGGRGGGVAVDGTNLLFLGGEVRACEATSGGGVALFGRCEACSRILQEVRLAANTAEDGGGWWTDGDANATALEVSGNTASSVGGGLYVAGGSVNDTASSYTDNLATVGAGVYWAGHGNLAAAQILRNVSTGDGAGLLLDEGGDLACSAVFAHNDAGGGAVGGLGGTVDLSGSTFDENEDYEFRVCGDPCVADDADVAYSGSCVFPDVGCELDPGFCAADPTCP